MNGRRVVIGDYLSKASDAIAKVFRPTENPHFPADGFPRLAVQMFAAGITDPLTDPAVTVKVTKTTGAGSADAALLVLEKPERNFDVTRLYATEVNQIAVFAHNYLDATIRVPATCVIALNGGNPQLVEDVLELDDFILQAMDYRVADPFSRGIIEVFGRYL